MSANETSLSWIAIYAALVVGLVALILLVSSRLGERHRGHGTRVPFESGVLPTGAAHAHFLARFYPIGVLFVIFDIETVFLFAWSIALGDLGWTAYASGAVFAFLLLVPLVYLVRAGALASIAPRIRSRHATKSV
jgi:NADH-quinone oxidoreductase subunit A